MPQPNIYTRIIGCIAFFLSPSIAQENVVQVSAIESIRRQAFEGSRVMHYSWYLTDVHGPRLTGSRGSATGLGSCNKGEDFRDTDISTDANCG